MSDCCNHNHPDHKAELARLNRLAGQVEGIKKMIEERRYCVDIITQLKAISSAAKSVESNILKRHLEACVKEAFEQENPEHSQQKIDELVKLFKKAD